MKLGREITNVSSIRLGRAIITPAQLLFAFLVFFCVSGAWAECVEKFGQVLIPSSCHNRDECSYYGGPSCTEFCSIEHIYNKPSNCEYVVSVSPSSSGANLCNPSAPNVCGTSGNQVSAALFVCCSDQCEADSLSCLQGGGTWTPSQVAGECGTCRNCDDKCQCEEEGGTWIASNGGYCLPKCQSKSCCDSLNKNLPTETDTYFLGCEAVDPENDKCVVYQTSVTGGDTTAAAECNGRSLYETCTVTYVWASGKNSDGQQCVPSPSYNCRKWSQRDSLCSGVICTAYQQHALGAITYNGSTGCYEGTETVNNMLTCSNGNVQHRGTYTRPFIVCDSYLDSLGMNISDYLAGATGSGPGTGIAGGDGSGGSGGSGSGSDNGMPDGYGGGTSTDNQGNQVINSASPGLGGYTTGVPQVVTTTDTTTGETTIVRNSQGGDSVVNVPQFFELSCLGVSGGIATLTNGSSTWTCEAMSCGSALISARLNGGRCSAASNNANPYGGGENSSLVTVAGDSSSFGYGYWFQDNVYRTFGQGIGGIVTALNGIEHRDSLNRERLSEEQNRHQDSLWRLTFGDNLDAVRNFELYISAASSANSQAISAASVQVSSANSAAIASASSQLSVAIGNVETAVNNMKNRLDNSISAASSANSNAISAAASLVSSANSRAVSAASSQITSASSVMRSTYMDSVRHTNELLESISWGLDTGSYMNRGIHKLDTSIMSLPKSIDSLYRISFDNIWNDQIKITMDSNAQKVADAIDSLQLEVKLDSIKIEVPHDSLLDSINDNLKNLTQVFESGAVFDPRVTDDTTDFGSVMQMAYDSATGDTSFVRDSSFSEYIKSRASQVNPGEDTFVDSAVATMQGRLDSARAYYNARSDTAVKAHSDSIMKYYGVSQIGNGVNNFFSGYSSQCPTECIDVKLTHPVFTGGQEMTIPLSRYICVERIIGSYTVLDFIKLVLKIMTSLLCMFLLLGMLPMQKGRK